MAYLLLGKRGGHFKSLLPSSRRGEYVWVLLSHRVIRGGVGRRDVTSTWAPVIKRGGSTLSKCVSGLSGHPITFPRPRCLVHRPMSLGAIWKIALSPLSLLLRTFQIRGLCAPQDGRKGSRRLHSGHLNRMYETRFVLKGDRGLFLCWLSGFGTIGDAVSHGSSTLVRCSLSRSRVWCS
ncbi:hypothetical protein TNCT_58751 [Trichonephila clavata]|uniref:Uncharacterized protein n=1 Tax=Trichonephila clavata TaxID=2740835 RepID=A0A8X6M4H8_TRICU|nr:hypothetical protein TNCT_58751 [Trichonephila clavata]